MGRNFQQELRRLDWTNLFDRSTNQPLFSRCVFSSKHKKHVWFLLLITWWNHETSCTAAHLDARSSVVFWVNFSGIPALFYRRRSLCLTALFGIISYPLQSLALTRSNSQHCSVLSRLLSSPWPALSRSSSPRLWLLILALCRSLSRSASVKPYLENVRSTPPIVCWHYK